MDIDDAMNKIKGNVHTVKQKVCMEKLNKPLANPVSYDLIYIWKSKKKTSS